MAISFCRKDSNKNVAMKLALRHTLDVMKFFWSDGKMSITESSCYYTERKLQTYLVANRQINKCPLFIPLLPHSSVY